MLPVGCDTTNIFSSHTCTTICHAAAASSVFGGFDMTTTGWQKKLVGEMPPAQTAANMNKCGGMGLVYLKAGMQPAQGLFLDKLTMATPPCGVQMPMSAAPLSADELACVQKWANNIVGGGSGI
jgi:hypothetical protein